MTYFILASILLFAIWFLFNPTTYRIRKINALLNKDRSVCDFINTLQGWEISPEKCDGVRMVIFPEILPKYDLYITYKNRRPENKDISQLYYALTNSESIVTKAHKMNVPVEQLIDNNNDETELGIIKKAIDCAKDMIVAENSYYQKIGSKDLALTLAKPTAIIDRFALIYAVVSVMLGKTIHKEFYALQLIDTMVKSGIITSEIEDTATFRFDERAKYFADEIEIEMQCSSFMPTALIYTLRHPSEVPTKAINKVTPVDALIQWNIILKVIKQYFNDNNKK